MPMCNTAAAVNDLLALAAEIASTEQIPIQEGMHCAHAELPRLTDEAT